MTEAQQSDVLSVSPADCLVFKDMNAGQSHKPIHVEAHVHSTLHGIRNGRR